MADSSFTVGEFLAWAKSKPADQSYNYSDNNNCALCQFLRETDRCADPLVGGASWWGTDQSGRSTKLPIPHELQGALIAPTFGQLVERLADFLPEQIVERSNWTRFDAYITDIEQVSA